MHDCTCREPKEVVVGNDEEANKAAFIENLQTLGWSPIVIPKAPFVAPSQEEILAIFRRRRQRREENCNDNGDVTFIASESGSSEGTIEPKESLEVQLSKCSNEASDADRDEVTVKNWCKALSWIAHKACEELLGLPTNAFLPSDPTDSLDLLRVFHYYAVPSTDLTLGSSEHTDWGSLTVVWQDSVGGLQTYCRKRQRWIDVKPAAERNEAKDDHCWRCIVHVGDMASLVLDDSKTESTSKETTNLEVSHPWPSPRHRVKSHPDKERVSLVYFGYPPRGVSLGEIQNRLDESWQLSSTRGKKLPLSEYFLLRNQSSGASEQDRESEASRLYQTMWNLPIEDIVRLKWEQVSR